MYIQDLINEFEVRFFEFMKYEKSFEIFSSPFTMDVSTVDDSLQIEIIDLQCNKDLKNLFLQSKNKIEFYGKYLLKKYPMLRKHMAQVIAILW